jgi:Ca2+-binding RTX toxin-like protein
MHDHHGNPSASPMFENLEPRQFLSATLDLGVLSVVGTHKSDNITLTIEDRSPDQVTVKINGFARRFALTDIDQINIQGGQGNDFIEIDAGKKNINMPTRIYGSGGDDTLIGGAAKDRFYGGSQNDIIQGNNGRDVIYGEAGDDTIDGGGGSDAIFGGTGNDSLTGGAGVDTLNGEDGDDRMEGVDGTTDSINGGLGDDSASADTVDGLFGIEHQSNE